MCTGLEIAALAGLALSAGGAVVQNQAVQKRAEAQADARNQQLLNFLDKNEALAQESRAELAKRLQSEEQDPLDQVEKPQQARQELATGLIDRSSAAAPIPLGGSAPKVVRDTAASESSRTDAEAKQRAEALSRVQAFGDLLFNKGMASKDAGNRIGMLGNFSQAEQALLPIQQDLAEQSKAGVGRSGEFFGGLAQGVGSLLSGAPSLAGSLGSAGTASRFAPMTSPIPVARPRTNLNVPLSL